MGTKSHVQIKGTSIECLNYGNKKANLGMKQAWKWAWSHSGPIPKWAKEQVGPTTHSNRKGTKMALCDDMTPIRGLPCTWVKGLQRARMDQKNRLENGIKKSTSILILISPSFKLKITLYFKEDCALKVISIVLFKTGFSNLARASWWNWSFFADGQK